MAHITIDPIPEFRCPAYNPDGELIGNLSEIEFYTLRLRIKETASVGYHMYFDYEIIPIDKDGRLAEWPNGFYDHSEKLLTKLL